MDARQVHLQVDPQMPGLVLQAAQASAEANQRTESMETQAMQAVLEAKGETSKVQAQAQVLVAKFAAELQASATREEALRSHVSSLQDAYPDAKFELANARQQIQALREESAAFKSQSVEALNGAGSVPKCLDEWKTRIESNRAVGAITPWRHERNTSPLRNRAPFLRIMVEELWWEVKSWRGASPSPVAAGGLEVRFQ